MDLKGAGLLGKALHLWAGNRGLQLRLLKNFRLLSHRLGRRWRHANTHILTLIYLYLPLHPGIGDYLSPRPSAGAGSVKLIGGLSGGGRLEAGGEDRELLAKVEALNMWVRLWPLDAGLGLVTGVGPLEQDAWSQGGGGGLASGLDPLEHALEHRGGGGLGHAAGRTDFGPAVEQLAHHVIHWAVSAALSTYPSSAVALSTYPSSGMRLSTCPIFGISPLPGSASPPPPFPHGVTPITLPASPSPPPLPHPSSTAQPASMRTPLEEAPRLADHKSMHLQAHMSTHLPAHAGPRPAGGAAHGPIPSPPPKKHGGAPQVSGAQSRQPPPLCGRVEGRVEEAAAAEAAEASSGPPSVGTPHVDQHAPSTVPHTQPPLWTIPASHTQPAPLSPSMAPHAPSTVPHTQPPLPPQAPSSKEPLTEPSVSCPLCGAPVWSFGGAGTLNGSGMEALCGHRWQGPTHSVNADRHKPGWDALVLERGKVWRDEHRRSGCPLALLSLPRPSTHFSVSLRDRATLLFFPPL